MSFKPRKSSVFIEPVKKSNDQLVNQDSGNFEYYTPVKFVESARKVMGVISLDPASSVNANLSVSAASIYTKKEDGLKQDWYGKVWMNHPFSKGERACKNHDKCKKEACKKRGYHIDIDMPGNADWINKLVSEYENGGVDCAICICFASTSEAWFQPLLKYPQCFIEGRVNYFDDQGNEVKGVTKGSVITYLGDDIKCFKEEFSQYGVVK